MALLMILGAVFAGVALMVIFGEKYGKPMEAEEQRKYSKIAMILVFVMLIAALLRHLFAG